MSRTRIKICGCTTPRDVALAVAAGADAVGLIFAPSPRRLSLAAAAEAARELAPFTAAVGVFVNPTMAQVQAARDLIPRLIVQLHGEETPEFAARLGTDVIKTVHVDSSEPDVEALDRAASAYPNTALLFDTSLRGRSGGSGATFSWDAVKTYARRRVVLIAGGLNAENVGACVRAVRPFGVDVRSGVESDGCKDENKMRAFVSAVREADAA